MKHCPTCGCPVHRLLVDRGDADLDYGRHVNFDIDPSGPWVREPLYGYMRRLGSRLVDTNLTRYRVHSCINQDALD